MAWTMPAPASAPNPFAKKKPLAAPDTSAPGGDGSVIDTTKPPDTAPQESSPTWDTTGGQYGGLEGDVLSQVRKGIAGPTDAVKAMITRGNEAVATKSRQLEGQAGAGGAAAGSLGQGTAVGLGQQTQQNILSTLSDNNLKNTQEVGDEQGRMLDRAGNMVQMNNQKQQAYQSTLAGLAQSNPTLAAKLQDYLVSGGTGSIGAFTPSEKAEMKAAATKAGAKQDVLDQIDQLNLTNLKGTSQTQNDNQSFQTAIAGASASGDYTGIDWSGPAATTYLNGLPTVSDSGDAAGFVSANKGKLMSAGGTPVVVGQYQQLRKDPHDAGNGHIDVIQGTNAKTGAPIWVNPATGKTSDTPPPASISGKGGLAAYKAWINALR